MRFPGQYFDAETNLHYNYFRDYDSEIGRYTQSDPIGLAGGINTFGYALQYPIKYTDAKGLAVPLAITACASNPACVAATTATVAALGCAITNCTDAIDNAINENTNNNIIPFPGTSIPNDTENVGANECPPPDNCKEWKAATLARKNNAEMLYLISGSSLQFSNINHEIGAYNNSCASKTGKISPLVVDLDSY